MMSSAMLRGRSVFLFSVIGLLRIVGEDDRRLAAIRVLDVGACEMKCADHRLLGIGAHLCQRAVQTLSGCSEAAEGVADRRAPIRASDELAGHTDTALR